MVINVPVFIHGMILGNTDPCADMRAFELELRAKLATLLPPPTFATYAPPIITRWGHVHPPNPVIRPDEKLTGTQETVNGLTRYAAVKSNPGLNSVIIKNRFRLPILSGPVGAVREKVVLTGLGDVAYYCSPEGEEAIREAIYGDIITTLDAIPGSAADAVKLHIVAHSLGATVAHDMLFGLFNPPPYVPTFATSLTVPAALRASFTNWRNRGTGAALPPLTLGSLNTAASQIPVTLFRKQSLINLLHGGGSLQAGTIGITPGAGVQWQIFYDIDDVVGYATRPLYDLQDEIRDVQVEASWNPAAAHNAYWRADDVLDRTAALIAARC